MFKIFKKKNKNANKYTITHNGNIELYSTHSYDDYLAYLLKPAVVIKESEINNSKNKLEEIIFDKNTLIDLTPSYEYSSKYERLHDNLAMFREIDDDAWLILSLIRVSESDVYYHINKKYLQRYAIACTKDLSLTITSKENSITLEYNKLSWKTFAMEIKIFELMCWVIDIFENFEPEIVNQFSEGIIDTLKTLMLFLSDNNSNINREKLICETRLYIKDVHETIISFGELIEESEKPFDIIRKQKEDDERKEKEAEENRKKEQEIYQSKQNDFIEKMKARRNLLEDFNEPLNNIPEKIATHNAEIDKRWSKA